MKILVKRSNSNYIAAATDKNYTPEQIEFIIEHGNNRALCDLIDQTRDEDIMAELLDRGCSTSVRKHIAKYTNDIDRIYRLLEDKSKFVKSTIYKRISSKQFDVNIIETLANDSDYKIRKAVAENTKDPEILRQLVRDPESTVRFSVAYNSQTIRYIDIIEVLAQDEYYGLRNYTTRYIPEYPKLLDIFLADSDEEVVASALRYASDDIKRQYLATTDSRKIRYNIAKTTEDLEILDILSYDSSESVRRAVISNEHTSTEILDRLALNATDDDNFVCLEALQTGKVSDSVVLKLAESGNHNQRISVAIVCRGKKYRDIQEMLAEDPDERIRDIVQRNLQWM